ncbi:MAG: hypothetical protein NVS4B11_30210 [Ktedonobacteraceae bacterium]
MNISTGGLHILFFERDQQLTALLTSEFQLAGYECHAARTAVEVFDTIARFPVRILLVNLAQAAAGRREFWVALDTQRRGRGVQVFTYRCSNLAGYGPRDADERSQVQVADMEIDGMLGLMSLVNVVRDRVPGAGSANSTGTQPRLARTVPPMQTNTNGTAYRTGPIVEKPSYQTPRTGPIIAPPATQAPSTTMNQQSYSEKIRAVLYPTQRPTNAQGTYVNTQTMQPAQEVEPAYSYDTQQGTQSVQNTPVTQQYDEDSTVLQRLAYGQIEAERDSRESGLDQLSRLLQERDNLTSDENTNSVAYQEEAHETPENQYATATMPTLSVEQNVVPMNYAPSPQTSQVTEAIGTQPLRASPIEDLPLDRVPNSSPMSDGLRRPDATTHTNHGQHGLGQAPNNQAPKAQTTPLASISTSRRSVPPAMAKATMPIPIVVPPQKASTPPVEEPAVSEQPSALAPQPGQAVKETLVGHDGSSEDEEEPTGNLPSIGQVEDEEDRDEVDNNRDRTEQVQQEQMPTQDVSKGRDTPEMGMSPNNAMLLDIVQSLPLMPSPPPQPPTPLQTVSGRTMRTLGSVLLEGHLVPQSRLEVAQNIQRMLRGVDLNYQLGEILLMFKLLTPDQLLAASLVSYGMISTQQISALGRIRQELHAIGLEYDLESLLVLFRMLTPDQLREVRASWQG